MLAVLIQPFQFWLLIGAEMDLGRRYAKNIRLVEFILATQLQSFTTRLLPRYQVACECDTDETRELATSFSPQIFVSHSIWHSVCTLYPFTAQDSRMSAFIVAVCSDSIRPSQTLEPMIL